MCFSDSVGVSILIEIQLFFFPILNATSKTNIAEKKGGNTERFRKLCNVKMNSEFFK